MLVVKNLNYRANKKFSIRDISFSLEKGYMMCLLGKNGAGKTTLLELLYGMLRPDSGSVEAQEQTAFVGGEDWCFPSWTMEHNRRQFALLYPNFDEGLYQEYLTLFGMEAEAENQQYSDLSTGQKMQFQIAFALAHKPGLLLLDEPMANLDPVARTDMMELLHQKVAREGMSVIISTHLVDDISDMVDYIGILDDGNMTDFGDRDALLEEYASTGVRDMLLSHGGKRDEYKNICR